VSGGGGQRQVQPPRIVARPGLQPSAGSAACSPTWPPPASSRRVHRRRWCCRTRGRETKVPSRGTFRQMCALGGGRTMRNRPRSAIALSGRRGPRRGDNANHGPGRSGRMNSAGGSHERQERT
jgi:hypothetical protein